MCVRARVCVIADRVCRQLIVSHLPRRVVSLDLPEAVATALAERFPYHSAFLRRI